MCAVVPRDPRLPRGWSICLETGSSDVGRWAEQFFNRLDEFRVLKRLGKESIVGRDPYWCLRTDENSIRRMLFAGGGVEILFAVKINHDDFG